MLLVALGLGLALAFLRGCALRVPGAPAPRPTPKRSPHLTLGTPTDSDPSDDIVLDEGDFVLSFNPVRLDPNWVAWQLDSRYLGKIARTGNFRADESLPAAATRVTPHDYLHSGFDRGHVCPSADRNATEAMNSVTFLMTNMIPQVHELNAGPWEKLEEHERRLAAAADAELYIVAGPVFDVHPRTIGRGVAVPKAMYKIIVVLSRGQTASDVGPDTRVTSVVVPNEPWVAGHGWREFVTSVDDIENRTGYDFLNAVPDEAETALESRRAL